MKLFITGATGFVGSHVAHLAAEQGAELRLLSRSSSNRTNLPKGADVVTGDLREPQSFASALQGCDAVIHVAADYRLWVPDPADMYKANVEGTRELLKLAREAGVPRVVYTSSVATMGFRTDGTVVNEDTPVTEAAMIGHYKRSKWMAEQVAIEAASAGQQVIILNPTTPIGAQDTKPTPTGRIVVDFLNKNFPAYVDTGLNLVDVREIARTHLLALERGRPGERYILGGENLTLKQILDRLAAITGLPSPKHKVPHAVAMAFAFFDEAITGKLRGKEPRATVEAVRMGKKMMFASSAKAERELGFRVLPLEDALREACRWFLANGYAPAAAGAALRQRIAILAALPRELQPLVRGWERVPSPRYVRMWKRVDADGDEVVAACAGMGVNAVRRAFAAVEQGGPIQLVLSVGLAGATSSELKLGEVCALSEVIDTATGERFLLTDGKRSLRIASIERTADAVEKQRLFATYGAVLVDMEAATVARLARMRDMPMCCFKTVSDAADAVLPDIDRFVDGEGQLHVLRFVGYLALHPRYWSAVGKLARGSSVASAALARALEQFLVHKDWEYTNRTAQFEKI